MLHTVKDFSGVNKHIFPAITTPMPYVVLSKNSIFDIFNGNPYFLLIIRFFILQLLQI